MKIIFLKQPQSSIKIEVLCFLSKNKKETKNMQNDFKSLIENYAFQGRDVKHLSKDELFSLTLAYIENKFSKWPWGICKASDDVDVVVTIGMLRNLNSNIYNYQKAFLEEFKVSVIDSQIDGVSETLDDEIEQARNKGFRDFDTDRKCLYEHTTINPLIAFNASRRQEEICGR